MVAFPCIKRIYADRGYRGNFIEEAKHDFNIDVEITHSNYSGKFVPAKKRWVVERTFVGLEIFLTGGKRIARSRHVIPSRANMLSKVDCIMLKLPNIHRAEEPLRRHRMTDIRKCFSKNQSKCFSVYEI